MTASTRRNRPIYRFKPLWRTDDPLEARWYERMAATRPGPPFFTVPVAAKRFTVRNWWGQTYGLSILLKSSMVRWLERAGMRGALDPDTWEHLFDRG